ncbi:MAG: 50S ribosomal protein L10 [Actinomycetota bacterium]|nr:50S ribosomal protein L10 [Actinomycetota bacterium]
MPRPEKVQAVADIKERLEGAQAVFLAEYAGLSVQEQQALRRELRANDAEFKVVKMTLARLAAADLDIEDLDELLLGPTGLTFADGDPVGAAKVLRDFAKDHEVLVIKGGLLGREFLTPERIAELADIEPREVLLAKIAGAFEAPMAKMAGLLAALPRNAATAMQQLLEKKQESSELSAVSDESEDESPAAEEAPPADEAPEAEAAVEVEGAPEVEKTAEVEEAPAPEVVEEAAEADEAPAAAEAPEAEAASEAELKAQSSKLKAEEPESDDEATAAEASDEDAGSESKDPDSAADDVAEEE